MVDMRNGDWEMDRTGPTDHFRPFQTPQTLQKRQKTQTLFKWDQKIVKHREQIPLPIPLWGALLYALTRFPISLLGLAGERGLCLSQVSEMGRS